MKTFVWEKNMAKVEKYDFMIHLLTFNVEILYDDIQGVHLILCFFTKIL